MNYRKRCIISKKIMWGTSPRLTPSKGSLHQEEGKRTRSLTFHIRANLARQLGSIRGVLDRSTTPSRGACRGRLGEDRTNTNNPKKSPAKKRDLRIFWLFPRSLDLLCNESSYGVPDDLVL